MKYNVIIFPGSNCDYDSYYAVKKIMQADVEYVWHKDTELKNPDCVILPGGFSYGDYLRAGGIAKFSPIMQEVVKFANKCGLVIGICNGFQMLTEASLLPGTLLQNKSLLFVCKHQYVKVINNNTSFTSSLKKGDVLDIPIAHNEGNYFIDEIGLQKLKDNKQIVFQYCDKNGNVNENANPNGSLENIAGIINKKGNVLGMMPHPERDSEPALNLADGQEIFKSIENYIIHKLKI
ncbi:MAG: phosphoribosylformylglycinamidine synthase subunit PurQ [Candidatus Cloacimonetes bacterium]|nr:phosphoribosylformylglycinamidine synthase subunit PurQ [Candidatus Cloacimonadota bacterium]MBL7086811.1 phosphoribosylformylglycinamidine synthase subunit PurQ [Candidatus Cloacimonadota bacterium]